MFFKDKPKQKKHMKTEDLLKVHRCVELEFYHQLGGLVTTHIKLKKYDEIYKFLKDNKMVVIDDKDICRESGHGRARCNDPIFINPTCIPHITLSKTNTSHWTNICRKCKEEYDFEKECYNCFEEDDENEN